MAGTIRVPVDYPAIQEALDAAKRDDTVLVAGGIYYENVKLREGVILQGGWDSGFSRRDISMYPSVINGERRGGWVVFGADEAVLDGFTVINGGSPFVEEGSDLGAGVHCKSTSPTIINNTIAANKAAGIYCSNSRAVIMDNVISGNNKSGIYFEKGSYLQIWGNRISHNGMAGISAGSLPASSMDVVGNLIHNNNRAGINGAWSTGTVYNNIIYENRLSGIRCGVTPIAIINNTVTANGLSGIISTGTHGTPEIKNNIISSNGKTGIKSDGKGYSHNLLYDNNEADNLYPDYIWYARLQFGGYEDELSYGVSSNIIADPMFVDASGHDYHLRSGSPAIDKGDPDPRFSDINFYPSLGTERNDMGAYGGSRTVPEIRGDNDPPVAGIDFPAEVYTGEKLILDGGKSIDPNGDALKYKWQLTGKPWSSAAELLEADTVRAVLSPDVEGEYTIKLTVRDRWGMAGSPHSVKINAFENRPPLVKIGVYVREVSVGDSVSLYVHEGSDPNGDSLSYKWELPFRPKNSKAEIKFDDTDKPVLRVDTPGCYTVRLTASDGEVDSEPDSADVCTRQSSGDGRLNVPVDYPSIQSAVDAASPGDEIIVAKGIYRENIVVDKSVNLVGIDWPVIDGGTPDSDLSTVFICYLDDMETGRVEGFVIKGGGKGAFGHGVKILNASPEIVNNQILDNGNVGLGIHGKDKFTGKTRIHGNAIYENIVGIGNGLEASGRIYDNTIYSNKVAGIGMMGLSMPKIDNNTIYNNYVGIGTRSESYPHIEANHIYDNNLGIAINPGTSAAVVEGGRSVNITNNAIYNNRQCGIYISSLNMSRIFMQENTIQGNSNIDNREIRKGGVVHGFPQKAVFGALLESNVVTSNNGRNIQYYEEAAAPPK